MTDNLPTKPDEGDLPLASEISILDKTNPRSVINLVADYVAEHLDTYALERPELFDCGEYELLKRLRAGERTPSPLDNRLRLQFWNEYHRVQTKNEKRMNMANVINGLCSAELFRTKYIKNPEKMSWLLCPPTGYMVKINESLEFAADQLREILDLPIRETTKDGIPYGRVDTKLAGMKVKIFEMLHTIVKGAPIQRNLNVNVTEKQVTEMAVAATDEDLARQLHELELRDRRARNLPDVKVVVSEVVKPEGLENG